MSRLNVFWPDEFSPTSTAVADAPVILRFPNRTREESHPRFDVVTRARLLFDNRRCRHCGYPVVTPLEQDDAMVNSSGLEIPGTATLIGFECASCDATWSV